jgi:hypothetical protein
MLKTWFNEYLTSETRSRRTFSDLYASKRCMEGPMPTKDAKSNSHDNAHGKRRWSPAVTTESTYPRAGLFNKETKTIARELASKKVSPKGPSSGVRMLTFYINRAGKNLPASRLKVLENAKELLHQRIAAAKNQEKGSAEKKPSHREKTAAA